MICSPFIPHIRVFSNGQFAIGKFTLLMGWMFRDTKDKVLWWPASNIYIKDCLVDDPKLLHANLALTSHKRYTT